MIEAGLKLKQLVDLSRLGTEVIRPPLAGQQGPGLEAH